MFFLSPSSMVLYLFACLLALSADGSSTHSIRYPNLHNRHRGRSFSKSPFLAVTGVQPNRTGSVPQRLEIRRLQQDPYQWNLYLLGLNHFQNMNQSTQSSYYQIAGIHGRPFIPWDNVAFAPGRTGGYCTHSSTLFPTWHRPYVALFEQVLHGIVRDIAWSFPASSQSRYVAAASTWRLPYWDWAAPSPAGQNTMPSAISNSKSIEVTTPTGSQTIPNPLYRYHFHPLDSSQLPDFPFSAWQHTLRYNSSSLPSATSQDSLISAQLDCNQASYSKRLLNLLQAYPTYNKFSNKAWLSNTTNPSGSYDSLESLHDAVHGLIGNGGHFTYNEYSAFDPIFMLHHANLDRIFAIWQTIWPNTYVGNTSATSGTATITPGDALSQDSPLKPFHRSRNGTFWTSAAIRDTRILGYTYPETADDSAPCAIQAVNYLYGPSAGKPANKTLSSRKHSKRDGPQQPGLYYEWITNIRVAQNALNSTFTVHIFLGNFSSNPKHWLTDPNQVGSHTIFLPFSSGTERNADLIVAGTVPLTKHLNYNAAVGPYNTANSTGVERYLRDNLHWRVAKLADSTEVSRESMPSLKVSVVSCPVTEAKSEYDFPNWGDCTTHTNITDSIPAGLQFDEPV